jgi:hypothetical protein
MKTVCALFVTAAFGLTALRGASEEELAIRTVLADSTGASRGRSCASPRAGASSRGGGPAEWNSSINPWTGS